MLSINRDVTMTIDGGFNARVSEGTKLVTFTAPMGEGEAAVFAQAALWLNDKSNSYTTVISTNLAYIWDSAEIELYLTVE